MAKKKAGDVPPKLTEAGAESRLAHGRRLSALKLIRWAAIRCCGGWRTTSWC